VGGARNLVEIGVNHDALAQGGAGGGEGWLIGAGDLLAGPKHPLAA
jgi:hypothetical protein